MLDTRNNLDLKIREERDLSNKLLVEHLFKIIEEIKPKFSFEIGAFSADFSKKIKNKFPNMSVYAFEANPYNFSHFNGKFKYKENDINYINMAISDLDGEVDFNIQRKINGKEINTVRGNNSIMNRIHNSTEYDIVKVKSTSMDKFISINNINISNSILWIDVEGATEKVLKGCEKVLNYVSVIFIEVEEKEFWENQWLEKDVNYFLRKNQFELIARDGEYEYQYNQIYINKKFNF
jgi:FkbM family methyltransferase